MKRIVALLALTSLSVGGFSQTFYDQNTIQTIELTFEQSNWDALLDAEKAGDGNYIMAQSVLINGLEYDSVGVKYKGNSTYNVNQVKNPFHIELDTYKDHEHDGYTDIK
ncbi:MAG: spore coat protein CotH, partial [Cryomorphaceae bacterium]